MGATLSLLSALVVGLPAEGSRIIGNARIAAGITQGDSPWDELWRSLTLGISLFNALLLVFLGLMVVLTSKRRAWGVWLVSIGLFLCAAVFLDNARCAGDQGIAGVSVLFHSWWPMGWFPAVVLPLAWHVAMLWYVGLWAGRSPERARLRRAHLPWLAATSALAMGGCALLAIAAATDLRRLIAIETSTVFHFPVLVLGYVGFMLIATTAPACALARPVGGFEPSRDLGRQRARPWLTAASAAMLVSGLAIAYVMLPVLGFFEILGVPSDYDVILRFCAWCDLVITFLVGVVILLLGQAVVAYEVFAGRTLPRQGLRRHAVNAAVLALAHAVIVPWAVTHWQGPVSGYLLAAVVGVSLYSLLAWTSYADRERWIGHLRPLVRGRPVFDQLHGPAAGEDGASPAFRSFCEEFLEAESVALVPTGPFAPLVGGALTYPEGSPISADLASRALARRGSEGLEPELLPSDGYGGYVWSVPLWGERGMTGLLLLGPKRHGLYTHEDLETAQLLAERLLDTEASFRLAQRLMELTRTRLAESQVLDRRLRREIHDEILPRLHAAMLGLPRGEGVGEETARTVEDLATVHRRLAALLREMPQASPEVERWGLLFALRRELTGPLAGSFDRVDWHVQGGAEGAAARLSPAASEVVFYAAREALRNAAAHARGQDPERPLSLEVGLSVDSGFRLTITDDGVGVEATRGTRARPGGRGLALHGTMLAILGGDLLVEAAQPMGTRVVLSLPPESLSPPAPAEGPGASAANRGSSR
jgi:signal transduction histidine kinase